MATVPPFSLTHSRYDQTTYYGRFRRMLDICDPSMLLYTSSSISNARESLLQFERLGDKSGTSDVDLWRFRKLKESAVHPDSGEIIPLPFRMSGYVPFNGPVSVGLILAQRTPWILFWQWVNQSQNALVNYFNRNATSKVSESTMLASYGGAVSSAMAIGYGLSRFVKNYFPPEKAVNVLKFIAMPTSVVASSVNCLIMRWPEISTGITVFNKSGEEVGVSQIAAKKAIQETVFSRMLLQVPVFIFPPMMTFLPPIANLLRKNPRLTTPITTAFLFIGFGFGLPASIAAFPQDGTLVESKAEPHLRGHGDLVYNKGL